MRNNRRASPDGGGVRGRSRGHRATAAAWLTEPDGRMTRICYSSSGLGSRNTTPLSAAIREKRVDVVELLLERFPTLLEETLAEKDRPLIVYDMVGFMANDGELELVNGMCHLYPDAQMPQESSLHARKFILFRKMLAAVKSAEDINRTDDVGKTPLHAACWLGLADVVAALLQAGASASVNKVESFFGKSPLSIACEKRREDIVRLLLDASGHDATTEHCSGRSVELVIVTAVRVDSVPIVQMLLLCKGVNANQCNNCGVTSLHVADSRPMVELLLAAGANPNVLATTNGPSLRAKNEKIVHFKAKKSTVYSASERGKADVVDALLSAGASHQANGSEARCSWRASGILPMSCVCCYATASIRTGIRKN